MLSAWEVEPRSNWASGSSAAPNCFQQAVAAGIMEPDQNTFVPAFYVEPSILADRDTLDFVRDAYLSHKNWYLWWGLGCQNFTDRSLTTRAAVVEMQREYEYVMTTKPRLQRAALRKTSLQIPLRLEARAG